MRTSNDRTRPARRRAQRADADSARVVVTGDRGRERDPPGVDVVLDATAKRRCARSRDHAARSCCVRSAATRAVRRASSSPPLAQAVRERFGDRRRRAVPASPTKTPASPTERTRGAARRAVRNRALGNSLATFAYDTADTCSAARSTAAHSGRTKAIRTTSRTTRPATPACAATTRSRAITSSRESTRAEHRAVGRVPRPHRHRHEHAGRVRSAGRRRQGRARRQHRSRDGVRRAQRRRLRPARLRADRAGQRHHAAA